MRIRRVAQHEEEEDILGESVRDFFLEDATNLLLSPGGRGIKVFDYPLDRIFNLFGFRVAGWGLAEDNHHEAILRVYPTREVKEPTTYQKVVEMRNRLDGLDKEKARKLTDYLKGIPEVSDAFVAPANDGHDWAMFHICFRHEITTAFRNPVGDVA